MADDVIVPGTGETLAFDEISGVKFARTKFVIGADGTNDGDVSSGNPLPVTRVPFSTGARTQVSDSSSDGVILAANADRKFASIENTSSAILYLGLGTTVTTATNYTVAMVEGAYYEVPAGFTGQIRGIWASDPGDGSALVTELT